MKKSILSFAAVLLVGCAADNGPLSIFQTEPLTQVLPCDSVFVDRPDTMSAARGENVTFQFILTSEQDVEGLSAEVTRTKGLGVKTGWVHDVHNENPTWGTDDMLEDPGNDYPDPIFDDWDEAITVGKHKTVWVDVAIPRDAKPGLHTCRLTVKGTAEGKEVSATKDFKVKVYPVTLPEEQGLDVVIWYQAAAVRYLGDKGEEVEVGSDRYYELLPKICELAAAYGQNCWKPQEDPVAVLNADSTDIAFDFTTYDRSVETFVKYGNMRHLHNNQFGSRNFALGWDGGHVFDIAYVENKELKKETVNYNDPRLKEYIYKYFPALQEHLREKGWLDMSLQHLIDEPSGPGTDSQKSYTMVAEMIHDAMPGMKILDACFSPIEGQDIPVVLLGPNIATMPPVEEGQQRFMYTASGPVGPFANRFIQLPLLKTRILHWLNYRYNESGYLHWGLNYWTYFRDPVGLTDVSTKCYWPGGDTHIIYPGHEKAYPSIRLCAMRDGIRDYDLLKMVEARDPQKAMEFARRVVFEPDVYEMDPAKFREIRRDILEYLSQE